LGEVGDVPKATKEDEKIMTVRLWGWFFEA